MTEEKNPLVKVDISSPVSLKAEIKAEVPTESAGRLLDTLTDAIRPFTEGRGLKADMIRLQREDVLLEIAKKAAKRLVIEGKAPHPTPNKFLVPFLELASLEDVQSELIDLWAKLLASASDKFDRKFIRYSKVLAELGCREVQMLTRLVNASRSGESVYRVEDVPVNFRNPMLQFLLDRQLRAVQDKWSKKQVPPSGKKFGMSVVEEIELPGGIVITCSMGLPAGSSADVLSPTEIYNPEFGLMSETDRVTISILQSLGLVRQEQIDSTTKDFDVFIEVIHLTEFGVGFYLACSPEVGAS